MADSLFGDLGLDEQTPNVLDFLGQEVPPGGGDFSEGANIVRNPGFVEGSEGLAFASSFDPSAPFWTVPPAGGSFAEGANPVTPPAPGALTGRQLAGALAPSVAARRR